MTEISLSHQEVPQLHQADLGLHLPDVYRRPERLQQNGDLADRPTGNRSYYTAHAILQGHVQPSLEGNASRDLRERRARQRNRSAETAAEELKRQIRKAEYRRRKTLERYFESSEPYLNGLELLKFDQGNVDSLSADSGGLLPPDTPPSNSLEAANGVLVDTVNGDIEFERSLSQYEHSIGPASGGAILRSAPAAIDQREHASGLHNIVEHDRLTDRPAEHLTFMETRSSVESLRRAAEQLESQKTEEMNAADSSGNEMPAGLATPSMCTPSPSPFKAARPIQSNGRESSVGRQANEYEIQPDPEPEAAPANESHLATVRPVHKRLMPLVTYEESDRSDGDGDGDMSATASLQERASFKEDADRIPISRVMHVWDKKAKRKAERSSDTSSYSAFAFLANDRVMSSRDTTDMHLTGLSNDEWEKPGSPKQSQHPYSIANEIQESQTGLELRLEATSATAAATQPTFQTAGSLTLQPPTPSLREDVAGPITPDNEEASHWQQAKRDRSAHRPQVSPSTETTESPAESPATKIAPTARPALTQPEQLKSVYLPNGQAPAKQASKLSRFTRKIWGNVLNGSKPSQKVLKSSVPVVAKEIPVSILNPKMIEPQSLVPNGPRTPINGEVETFKIEAPVGARSIRLSQDFKVDRRHLASKQGLAQSQLWRQRSNALNDAHQTASTAHHQSGPELADVQSRRSSMGARSPQTPRNRSHGKARENGQSAGPSPVVEVQFIQEEPIMQSPFKGARYFDESDDGEEAERLQRDSLRVKVPQSSAVRAGSTNEISTALSLNAAQGNVTRTRSLDSFLVKGTLLRSLECTARTQGLPSPRVTPRTLQMLRINPDPTLEEVPKSPSWQAQRQVLVAHAGHRRALEKAALKGRVSAAASKLVRSKSAGAFEQKKRSFSRSLQGALSLGLESKSAAAERRSLEQAASSLMQEELRENSYKSRVSNSRDQASRRGSLGHQEIHRYTSEIQPDFANADANAFVKRRQNKRRPRPVAASSKYRDHGFDSMQDSHPVDRNGLRQSIDVCPRNLVPSHAPYRASSLTLKLGGEKKGDASLVEECDLSDRPLLLLGSLPMGTADRYEGQMAEGTASGLGMMTCEDGSRYAGQWRNGHFNGYGQDSYAKNSGAVQYRGQFADSQAHGWGVCVYSDGSKYLGEWQRGQQHGLGHQVSMEPEGRFCYIGCFVHGVRNKTGVAFFPNGEEFSGQMLDGTPHGYGVARLEGRKGLYAGQWLEGRRHGWAISTLLNGTLWAGQWIFGRACWLADMGLVVDSDLGDDVLEALDLCQEAANSARVVGMQADEQAKSILEADSSFQTCLQKALKAADKAAFDGSKKAQRARVLHHSYQPQPHVLKGPI